MRIDIITLFPGMFHGPLTESILQRAQDEGLLQICFHDLKTFGIGGYKQVDDEPYGGGAGMVMRVDVLAQAIEEVVGNTSHESEHVTRDKHGPAAGIRSPYKIYLSPRGNRLTQEKVEELANKDHLLLLCGHYEGIDQRVIDGGWIDEEISIGDYVLTGGELPAMVLIDAVARHIPGVLGDHASAHEESFSVALDRKTEYPHYTRPEDFRGLKVPEILLSGHHAKIEAWRKGRTGG